MSDMTKREIEIVRRFKAGESVAELGEDVQVGSRWDGDYDMQNGRILIAIMKQPPFSINEVNAALRKAVHAVPQELWNEWARGKNA